MTGNDDGAMPPPPPRPFKRRAPGGEIILEEEDWLAKMDGIIERDFFPELGSLQDKVAWLEASRSGNPEAIRAAQIRIAQRRMGITPGRTAGGVGGGVTPVGWTPATAPRHGDVDTSTSTNNSADEEVPPVSLDAFLSKHTSEDNASFSEILQRTNKRRRERAMQLYGSGSGSTLAITQGQEGPGNNSIDAKKNDNNNNRDRQLALLPSSASASASAAQRFQTDGFGTSGQQPDTLRGWKPRSNGAGPTTNLFMYNGATRSSLPPSRREAAAGGGGGGGGGPRGINHRATRLHQPREMTAAGAATPSTSVDTASTSMAVGNDDEVEAGGGGGGGGGGAYDILATPSFEPGVDASPLITWGDIEATPLRVDADLELPGGGGGTGPSFRINATPARELAAHELAARAGSARRRGISGGGGSGSRGGAGMTPARAAALAALGRATPVHGGRGAGGATPLSHAAHRLVNQLKKRKKNDGGGGGGGGVFGGDAALRASYGHGGGGGPGRGGGNVDGVGSGWDSSASTPAHGGGGAGHWTPRAP